MTTKTEKFAALHQAKQVLCLPNAWDAGSAKILESVGAPAIATTSAGVAWSQGYPDGRVMPFEVALAAARSIARVLNVPLSFDVEHGYGDDPATVAANVVQFAEAGVAGINIEDGPDAPQVLAAKISAIKEATDKAGLRVFVNARTDVYLASLAPAGKQVEEVLARAELYAKAGADGLFVPAIVAADDIKAVASQVALPLNVMAWPGLPAAAELFDLGVRRLSAGSGITQVAWEGVRTMGKSFLESGNSAPMMSNYMPHAQLQQLFRSL